MISTVNNCESRGCQQHQQHEQQQQQEQEQEQEHRNASSITPAGCFQLILSLQLKLISGLAGNTLIQRFSIVNTSPHTHNPLPSHSAFSRRHQCNQLFHRYSSIRCYALINSLYPIQLICISLFLLLLLVFI